MDLRSYQSAASETDCLPAGGNADLIVPLLGLAGEVGELQSEYKKALRDGDAVLNDFLNKFHDRISSFHIKDRTTVEHCQLNLAWGQGETPIKEMLRLVRDKKWNIPATIEQEYAIPADSDAVKEVRKCVQFCKDALA